MGGKHIPDHLVEGAGSTTKISEWISQLDASQIPTEELERAKYLILDGLICGLVGARVPWSEDAYNALTAYEPEGACSVWGYGTKLSPIAACTLNGTFVQATELDDYHSESPLHSMSVILTALLAAAESEKDTQRKAGRPADGPSGMDFLVASIAGFETAARVGRALNGPEMVTQGWHSGPIFGAPAAAAACSRLLKLNPEYTESAIGIACTQACGLMSAQYESMVKRMQHAFAARNGLFAALLARSGYVGIKKVFERPYGGFLKQFSQGSDTEPKFHIHEITSNLGEEWKLWKIRVKLHASVCGAHGHIELLAKLQKEHPERFTRKSLDKIKKMTIGLSAAIFAHDGWTPETRPMTSTGAQMCSAWINATQLVDGQVLLREFADHNLDRQELWELVWKTECYHEPKFDVRNKSCGARLKIEFDDGFVLDDSVDWPKGYDPLLSNEDILEKYRKLAVDVIDKERMDAIEDAILNMDKLDDVTKLAELLGPVCGNPFAIKNE